MTIAEQSIIQKLNTYLITSGGFPEDFLVLTELGDGITEYSHCIYDCLRADENDKVAYNYKGPDIACVLRIREGQAISSLATCKLVCGPETAAKAKEYAVQLRDKGPELAFSDAEDGVYFMTGITIAEDRPDWAEQMLRWLDSEGNMETFVYRMLFEVCENLLLYMDAILKILDEIGGDAAEPDDSRKKE